MQSLEIRDEIYERFLAFKVKYNPNLSNEEFIQFLMTRYENCCSRAYSNGYTNGLTEYCKSESEVLIANIDNNNFDNNTDYEAQVKENDKVSPSPNYRLITCPECKFTSGDQTEIEQHFNDSHDMIGVFPCTCEQCFCNLSQFLAHYVVCPIAATDLQNTGIEDEPFEDEEDHNEDSDGQLIDFHADSPTGSNPLNLVKNVSSNGPSNGIDPSNAVDVFVLPDHHPSSLAGSSPGNQDLCRKSGKLYDCEHCEKTFKSKGLLDQHKHLHFPPRHECEFCGRRFRWPPQFYTHKQQCSKRKFPIVPGSPAGNNNFKKNCYNFSANNNNNNNHGVQQTGKMFPLCPVVEQCLCGYKNGIASEMYEHKRACVASARALILQKIYDYNTVQPPSLQSVIGNFIPATPDKPVPGSGSVMTQNPKPNELKPFECDFCESRFMTKISLKQHLDGKHSDQAKYCCEKCGKGYFWNASYNYHKKKCTFQPLTNGLQQ